MIYLEEEGSMSQTFVMFIQGAVTIILNVSSMAGSIGGQTETLDTNPQSAWKRLLTMPFPYVMLLMFHQRLHFTPASNLGYLVPPPGQYFMGAKSFIGTPWMRNEGVLKQFLVQAI